MATKIFKLPQFSAEVILPKEYEATNVVVAGGRAPKASWLQKVAHNKKVYCADKGIEICLEAGVIPLELYGDGDSAPKELYERRVFKNVIILGKNITPGFIKNIYKLKGDKYVSVY